MKPFCDILKKKRLDLNMTRRDLSEKSGVSMSAIGFYETGENEPKATALLQLARALHTSIDDLVGYEVEALPTYERYKRYLESIGASVREDASGFIVVTIPSRNKCMPLIEENKESFCELIRVFEKDAIAQVEKEKEKFILDSIQHYADTAALAVQMILFEKRKKMSDKKSPLKPCDITDNEFQDFFANDSKVNALFARVQKYMQETSTSPSADDPNDGNKKAPQPKQAKAKRASGRKGGMLKNEYTPSDKSTAYPKMDTPSIQRGIPKNGEA